ncbi:LOB domain-containing protein 15 [Impatiens glandulifera]|uniref:LOB domain-containing protein 15 n=1 Tax=Impatiens glandulifera TaxID=253017 RepID=UPI001FB0C84D|nr:LOB domain-containing protein 15 [Impatiens glandulifera]
MSRERESTYDIEIGKKIKRENEAALAAAALAGQIGRQQQQQAGSSTLNTITPCAACKLLRRRCAEECPFSPYFSPHEPQKFAAVHKVFGASNVSKMLMEVAEIQRADAANSLVYEANVRLRDPVYGCMGAISALQQQVQLLQAELNAIRTEIFKYKYTNLMPPPPPPPSNHNHNHNPHHQASAIPTSLLVSSAGNLVSVAALPPSTANLPAQLSLPPPSTVVVSSTSSPSSSLSVSNSFATKSSGYNNNNIASNGTTGLPYFG